MFDMSWDQKTGYKTTQLLAAPIKFKKYLLGVIQLINKTNGNAFTVEDQRSLIEIAEVLAIAFYNHNRLKQRARRSKFDYLISSNVITSKDLESAINLARKKKYRGKCSYK